MGVQMGELVRGRSEGRASGLHRRLRRVTLGALAAAAIAASHQSLAADEGWMLRKEAGGIRVYTREQPNSKFEAVRAEMILDDVRLASLVALIDDPSACALLESRCAEAYTLDRPSDSEHLIYRHNDMPFPIKDRDVVLHFSWRQNPDTLVVDLESRHVEGVLPVDPRRVRLPSVAVGWRFVPLADGRVEASSEGHIEPGANLPAWLLNTLLVDAPFKTMEAVAEVVRQPRYRDAELGFIRDAATD